MIKWAKYEILKNPETDPRITHLEISVLGLEGYGGKRHFWWQLAVFEREKLKYALKLLVDSFDFLIESKIIPNPAGYVFYEVGTNALEYINVHTDKAILPEIDSKKLLPCPSSNDQGFPFFKNGRYLGHQIRMIESGESSVDLISNAKKLKLDPDLIIGTGRNFREAEGKRIYYPGKPAPDGNPDYNYVKFTSKEYKEMIQAGVNLFIISSDQLGYVLEQPVYFVCGVDGLKIPELLYRSNYKGTVQFMDEPVYLAMAHQELTAATTPSEAADKVVAQIQERFLGDGSYMDREP